MDNVLYISMAGASEIMQAQTIHVTWEESPPPVEGLDYHVNGLDVELETGSMTWRIWATNAGILGTITCPHPANFGVKFEDDAGGPGAERVTDINLIPSDLDNYSNITGAGSRISYSAWKCSSLTPAATGARWTTSPSS